MEAVAHCRNHPEAIDGLRPCSRCNDFLCGDCLVDISGHLVCANCKSEELLDVRSGVGGQSRLEFATTSRRFGALILDNLPLSTATRLLGAWLLGKGILYPTIFGPLQIATLLVFMTYEAVMLQWRGQTLGKMAVRIKVVAMDGTDISIGQAWWRAFLRGILAYLIIVDYIPAYLTRERTCVHDLLARTRVVNVD